VNTFLVTDALRKVWCNPFQDKQFIIEPARITPAPGAVGTFQLQWDTVNLPTSSDTYHVFQLGQLDPSYLNLMTGENVWHSFTEIMRNQKIILVPYNEKGWVAPRFEAWILSYTDQNLLIAIKDQKPRADFGTYPLFVRFYSNAWYNGESGATAPGGVYTAGLRLTSTTGAVGLQNVATPYQGMGPGFQWFHNGYLVDNVQPGRMAIGDTVEFVYDASVRQVLDVPVSQLGQFQSTLDATPKYLIHNTVPYRATIDFQDDVDVYLNNPGANSTYQGLYYHKNNDAALRQVTQQDYSMPTTYVSAFAEDQTDWLVSELTVRLYIRNGGYAGRPLVYENDRIFELYRLPDAEIVPAMVGTASNVPNWQAATLEASEYVAIMGANGNVITQDMVQSAYGYNAISKLTGDTPSLVQTLGQGQGVYLAESLKTNSTIYEYDNNRLLLGIYNHLSGDIYYPINGTCQMIEAIVGTGGIDTGMIIYQAPTTMPLNPDIGQRVYMSANFNGDIANNWVDITGDTTYYTVSTDGTLGTFVQDTTDMFIAVKGDDKFLTYQFNAQSTDGTLIFTASGIITLPGGEGVTADYIPPGQVDVWMNGSALIQNVDFYVSWPLISICNTKYLNVVTGIQLITARFTGFCDNTMHEVGASDTGFIKYGVLSRNNRFDIRDDKVMRIIAGGKVFLQSELAFSEDDNSLTVTQVPNGSPYSLEEIVVPLRQLVDTDTYTMRAASMVIDAAVGAYLTPLLPDAPETVPDVIPSLYEVYSPFMTKIISDVKSGAISMTPFSGLYGDPDVKAALASYNDILVLDPIWNGVDTLHVLVIAHPWAAPVTVSAYQYKFLQAVNRAFLGGRLDLSPYLVMSANGL
jgi:hypothetical protein